MIAPLRPYPVEYQTNPDPESLSARLPPDVTGGGTVHVLYITDLPSAQPGVDTETAAAWIAQQTAYIVETGALIEVQGFFGERPRAVPVQWLYTPEGAPLAAALSRQVRPAASILPPGDPFRPMFRVICTPNLRLEGGPEDVPSPPLLLVDVEGLTAHIIGWGDLEVSLTAAKHLIEEESLSEGSGDPSGTEQG